MAQECIGLQCKAKLNCYWPQCGMTKNINAVIKSVPLINYISTPMPFEW